MMSATLAPDHAGWYVVAHVGTHCFAFPSANVSEMLRNRSFSYTKLPTANAAIRGIFNHRGVVLPLVEFRELIGEKSFEVEVSELTAFIQAREADHLAWLEALKASVMTGEAFTKKTDPKLCAFGKWYESLMSDAAARNQFTDGNATLENILSLFDAPHKNIHAVADKVLAASKAGRQAEALSLLDTAWKTDFTELTRLFREFETAFAEHRRPCVLVIDYGDHPFGLVVDEVSAVTFCENDLFEDAPDEAGQHASFSEYLLRWNGELSLVLNLELLVDAIAPQVAA